MTKKQALMMVVPFGLLIATGAAASHDVGGFYSTSDSSVPTGKSIVRCVNDPSIGFYGGMADANYRAFNGVGTLVCGNTTAQVGVTTFIPCASGATRDVRMRFDSDALASDLAQANCWVSNLGTGACVVKRARSNIPSFVCNNGNCNPNSFSNCVTRTFTAFGLGRN